MIPMDTRMRLIRECASALKELASVPQKDWTNTMGEHLVFARNFLDVATAQKKTQPP